METGEKKLSAEEIIDKHKNHSGIDYYYKSEIIPMMQEYSDQEIAGRINRADYDQLKQVIEKQDERATYWKEQNAELKKENEILKQVLSSCNKIEHSLQAAIKVIIQKADMMHEALKKIRYRSEDKYIRELAQQELSKYDQE